MQTWANIFLLLSILASIYTFFVREYKVLRFFLPFLLLSLCIELYSEHLSEKGQNNIWLGNLISVCSIFYYLIFVSTFIKNKLVKRILQVTSLLFLLGFIGNCLFFQPISDFHLHEVTIGCFFLVCACVYFFFELLNYPNDTQLMTYPPFWITAGLLFNNVCSMPIYMFFNFIMQQDYKVVVSIFIVLQFLNIMLYILLIISFLCKITLPKRS